MTKYLTALLILWTSLFLNAEDAKPKPERKTFHIKQTSSKIKIDGVLDEQAWAEAVPMELAYETRPANNTPPKAKTDCRMTYDATSLYVGCHAYDPDPSKIRARYTDRDKAYQDDFVGVVLDTFNDERRAFEFFVNPLGVQMDLINDDVGGSEDDSWDTIWNTSGRLVSDGFIVEMEVPFSSLRFPSGAATQTWGLDVVRIYPRDRNYRLGVHPLDRDISCYLCQGYYVTGFEGIHAGKNLEIDPTLTAHRTETRQDFPNGGFNSDSNVDPGVSVGWGITPNWTMNGTLNPDFSQVEADAAQLDVNTDFALFFPEKRPFFLEGADFFATPLNAVFTRNVADPIGGLKLTGKTNNNAAGVFLSQDQITNLLIPGSQRSRSTTLETDSTDSVLRYRRDVGKNSALGLLVTDRESSDYFNRLAGMDAKLHLGKSENIRVQALGSTSQYPDSISAAFDQPQNSFSDYAFYANYEHNANNWLWYAQYQNIGTKFRADMGFLPRVDFTYGLAGINYTIHGTDQNFFSSINFGADYDQTKEQSGFLIEREYEFWLEGQGPKQSFFSIDGGWRKRGFNNTQFHQNFLNLYFEIRPTANLFLSNRGKLGDELDVVNTRNGKLFRTNPVINYKIGRHWQIEFNHLYERLNIHDQRLYSANLSQAHLIYQINTRTFVRAILQYTDVDRNIGLYTVKVEPRSKALFSQFLFSYKLNPQTVLFIGYSDNYFGNHTVDITQTDRTVFFKIGYAWRM